MSAWPALAAIMAGELASNGYLTDPLWHRAFSDIPRHRFVPRFYDDDGTLIDGDDPAHRAEWLAAVYSDDSLVIQRAQVAGTDLMWPTSSSTMPSLMARMLELLEAEDRHTVLEIGTGTGYNAALLCHRLGDTHVASIDIDPKLTDLASTRLAELSYKPHIVAGDGADGIPDHASYDRIIATCAVPTIPTAWIDQLSEHGIVVADLRGELSSNLIALHKNGSNTAEGRFLATPGHFMWLRRQVGNPLRDGGELQLTRNIDNPDHGRTRIDPALLATPGFRFVVQLHLPDLNRVSHDERGSIVLTADDGSWAEVETTTDHHGYHPTKQGGSQPIWDRIEQAASLWNKLGQPTPDRFGMTASTEPAECRLWLDTPTQPISIPDTAR